jgi:hypothetical protein
VESIAFFTLRHVAGLVDVGTPAGRIFFLRGKILFLKNSAVSDHEENNLLTSTGENMSDPAEVGRAHGLDDKEIEELKKEFETADTDKTGRISENQLRKLVFNRLYKERHPAKLASLSSVLQFPSEELPGDMLSVANSEGFGMDKKFSVVEAESLLSTTTAGQKEPARDTLDPSQSRSSGRRRKSLSLASSSANSSPLAGVSAANGTAQTASWGNPEKAAYSWQTQFATDTGRRRSMMAKDSVLGMLPKEYLEDAQTAKLVASNGVCTPVLLPL